MKVELPDLTRCCFCLPLRKGILSWAYVKLAITLIFTLLYTNLMSFSIMMGGLRPTLDTVILIAIFLLLIADIIFTIVLIIGGHTKGYKLLRAFFYYGCANLILEFIFMIIQTTHIATARYLRDRTRHLTALISVSTTYIIFGGYMLLLVRSEMKKLKNEIKIEFVNNAAEAECTMISENYIKE